MWLEVAAVLSGLTVRMAKCDPVGVCNLQCSIAVSRTVQWTLLADRTKALQALSLGVKKAKFGEARPLRSPVYFALHVLGAGEGGEHRSPKTGRSSRSSPSEVRGGQAIDRLLRLSTREVCPKQLPRIGCIVARELLGNGCRTPLFGVGPVY